MLKKAIPRTKFNLCKVNVDAQNMECIIDYLFASHGSEHRTMCLGWLRFEITFLRLVVEVS